MADLREHQALPRQWHITDEEGGVWKDGCPESYLFSQ